MKKLILIAFCTFGILFSIGAAYAPKEMDYLTYADELQLAEIIDSHDLTAEMLESRNGKLIIERVVGVVDNAETGAGHEIGTDYFISYARIPDISKGDVICSYFIYNPSNNAIDDIEVRYDYIIDDKE